jgi:guanosine-3',5'-bis(diphosphate) 3'-pyrophosphohydrolase
MSIEESDLKKLLKALQFAALKHRNQRRKDIDASPYINHPISLASILCNEAHVTDVEVICGALLHDTVEDTETTAEELERQFGLTVRNIVMDVTDDKSLKKHERKQAQIDHAAHISDKAKLVKLADKISNLRDVSSNPPPETATWRQPRFGNYL